MKNFPRETATELADLPHQLEGHAADGHCELCTEGPGDPRHVAWERAQIAEKASWASPFQRETGS